MRFTILREEFLKGLSTANRAVGGKASPVASLVNLKIELNERGLFITGSNYNFTIRSFTPYSRGEKEIIRNYKEGCVLVTADLITNIIRKIESEEVMFEVIDSTNAVISNNRSEYNLQCVRADEYPDLDLEPDGTELSLTRQEFTSLVSQTAFAASLKEQRLILTALNLEASNGILVATATDSARMARKELQIPQEINFVTNIPAKMMEEIARLVAESENVKISISDKKALFSYNGNVIATRLVAGEYPNTKNIIPHTIYHSLEVKSQDLIKTIERINILSVERENVVDLYADEEKVEITAKSSQIGYAAETLENYKYTGQPIKISFNSDYVLTAIKAMNCEEVVLEFIGEMKPFVIKNPQDDSVIQIVTPVRTYY